MSSHPSPPAGAARDLQQGFSVVEVMLASVLLLFIALGILPLFAQSISNNLAGHESTEVSNSARSRLEEFYQLPFGAEPLQVTSGTERQYDEYYSHDQKRWIDGTIADVVAPDRAQWTRTTFVRQYHAGELTTPLDATVDPSFVQVKEIEVRVASPRTGGILGGGKRITARIFKSE